MKDKKYLYPGLVAIFCALIAVFSGWVYLAYSSPGTTTIGENISTTDLTVSGNATTTGNFVVNGNTILGNAAADTLTVNANTTFATTTIFNGPITLGDGGETIVINSSDWDISATGDMTGIGNITADGTISFTGSSLTLGDADSDTLTVNATTTFATTTIFNGAVTINSAKVGTNFVIDSSGNASTTGNLIVGGTTNLGNTTIGSGNAITKHETKLISVDFNLDTENACTVATTTISGAVATSTVTVGMPHTPANLVGTTGSYWGAWVSGVTSADEVSFRYCTGSGVGATTTDATLDVRLDLWKH